MTKRPKLSSKVVAEMTNLSGASSSTIHRYYRGASVSDMARRAIESAAFELGYHWIVGAPDVVRVERAAEETTTVAGAECAQRDTAQPTPPFIAARVVVPGTRDGSWVQRFVVLPRQGDFVAGRHYDAREVVAVTHAPWGVEIELEAVRGEDRYDA